MINRDERGKFVVLVGPDGVGKTSVAVEIQRQTDARYFHFRPTLGRSWPSPKPGQVLEKPTHVGGAFLSVLRLLLSWARFWLGYLLKIRPELRRGRHVIGDRWAFGYLAKPRELRYFGPRFLAVWAVRLLPRQSLVVCLTAPPDVVRSRKPELTEAEIVADGNAWRSLPVQNLVEVPAVDDLATVANQVIALLMCEE